MNPPIVMITKPYVLKYTYIPKKIVNFFNNGKQYKIDIKINYTNYKFLNKNDTVGKFLFLAVTCLTFPVKIRHVFMV